MTNEVNFTDLARLLRRRLRRRARRARPGRDRGQGRGGRRAATRSSRSASTGPTATTRRSEESFWGYLRDHGGPPFVARASTGSASTPTRGPSSRRPSRPAASATGMVTAMSELRAATCRSPGIPAARADPHRGERLADRHRAAPRTQQAQALRAMVARRQRLPRHLQRHRLPLVRPARPSDQSLQTSNITTACSATTTARSRPSAPTGS